MKAQQEISEQNEVQMEEVEEHKGSANDSMIRDESGRLSIKQGSQSMD